MKPRFSPRAIRWASLVLLLSLVSSSGRPPELDALEKRRAALVAERVDGPYEKELARLSKGYLAALDREIQKRRQAADLDALVVFTEEKKRVEEGRDLAGDETTDPPLLKELRRTWRASLAKPTAVRDAERARLLQQYQANLAKLEAEMTQAGRVDDALAVRATRESVEARIGMDKEAPALPSGMVQAPALPPDLQEKPPAPAHTASLIAWALTQPGAAIGIRHEKGFRWLKNDDDDRKDERLPAGRFSLTKLEVTRFSPDGKKQFRPEWLLGQTDFEELRLDLPFRDFGVLRGMKQLYRIEFGHQTVVTDDDLLRLPLLPEMKRASIAGEYGDTGVAILASRLPAIEELSLGGSAITPTGLRPLALSKNLAGLSIRGTASVTAACTELPPLKIVSLKFSAVGGVTVESWRKLAIPAGMKYFEVFDGPMAAGALAAVDWSRAKSLEKVFFHHLNGSPVADLRALDALPRLTSLQIDQLPVAPRDLAAAAFVPRLHALRIAGAADWSDDDALAVVRRAGSLTTLHLHGSAFSDGLVAPVVEALPRLKDLSLGSPGLTDACTVPLKELRKLEVLGLSAPRLSLAGLAEIRQVRGLKKLVLVKPGIPRPDLDLFKLENPAIAVELR